MTDDSPIRFRVEPGHPLQNELKLRVSPGAAEALVDALEAEDLRTGRVMEFSQFDPNSTVAYMVYGVGMATVAVDRLASAISKWSHRRDGKSIEFFEDGQIKVITGFSQDQARALIDEAITRQCNVDRQWQEHAMRHPRPARPPRPEDTPPEP